MRMHEENLRARDEMLVGMTNQYGRLGYVFAILLAISILGTFSIGHAEETVKDKVVETGHDVKRDTKKMAHRTKEAFCAQGDAACLAEKAKHRVKEGTEYMGDKSNELENKTK